MMKNFVEYVPIRKKPMWSELARKSVAEANKKRKGKHYKKYFKSL